VWAFGRRGKGERERRGEEMGGRGGGWGMGDGVGVVG